MSFCEIFRALASIVATLVLACAARAERPAPTSLQLVRGPGAEDCADAKRLASRLEQRLGHPVFFAPSAATLSVEGLIERAPRGYRATLRMFDDDGGELGSRQVESAADDCDELSETLLLVLGVMIDPEGALEASAAPAPRTPPASAPADAPAAPRSEASAPADSPEPKDRDLPLDLSGFARLALGQLPGTAWGLGAALRVHALPRLTIRLEGAGYFEREATLADGGGARLRLLVGGVLACPVRVGAERYAVWGCAGVTAGALESRAFALDPNENDHLDPVLDAVARIAAEARVGRVRALLGASLSVPMLRTLFEATTREGETVELFEQAAVGGAIDLGVGLSF